MGITVQAELHYGYDLGGSEGGWNFAEVETDDDEYSTTPTVDWWDEDGDSFDEQAKERLLAAAGFTETNWRADGYFDRRREAEARFGVDFKITGYETNRTLLVIAGHDYTAYSSESTALDPAVMTGVADGSADEALANAVRVLGITPTQEKPMWLLTCYYG